ncbi:hypothetical protein K493DRAFT_286023 [Basidiobolus meristosporus CBS 931.73]|uniref:SAC3/GANP/THP3 conserved domain-containing protein n=1 Tax=Basidiobolus meristosporus CBS 931.73 TaxID=1314790 RepID=A0A1Y1Y3R2_9FUNG|nr:hypothetical protein K493DRAFT_286023 [Basidiobolus meristosporus CBS 931.73]|eukprot:ORX92234.1 hypothetical protein K493DRAFT_286023 [Basidiobolus meristosporus CBS 931.73]
MIRNKRGGFTKEESQTSEERVARFNNVPEANRYQELKALRPNLRAEYIAKGLIQDPTKPIRLDQAINFVGTCQDMCPEFEREEREYQKNLEKFELIPGTNRIDHSRAVKAYHRPAAGNEQPLPSDVRPPAVLTSTLDYLIDEIVDNDPGLEDSHGFIRDRTRSIRQDFTLQNCRNLEAVLAHERIARYHILCLHQLCDNPNFSEQQETEQLRKVLRSLQEFYDDLREEGIPCPNEAEFRAYNIITHLRDIDIARQAQLYPKEVFCSSIVQQALKFHSLCQCNNVYFKRNMSPNCEASQNFFSKFFKLVKHKHTSYLMSCLLEWHFVEVRRNALKAMNKTYLYQLQGFPISDLVDLLWFDDADQAIQACQEYGLEVVEDPVLAVKFGKKDAKSKRLVFYESDQTFKQIKSLTLVEQKRGGLSNRDIVNGTASQGGPHPSPFTMTFDLTLPESTYVDTDSKSRKRSNGVASEATMARSIPTALKSAAFPIQASASPLPSAGIKPGFSFSLSALENKAQPSHDASTTFVTKPFVATPITSTFSTQIAPPQPNLATSISATPGVAIPTTLGTNKQESLGDAAKSDQVSEKKAVSTPNTELVKQRLAALEKAKKEKEEANRRQLIGAIAEQMLQGVVLETVGKHISTVVQSTVVQYIEQERRKNALLESIAEEAFQYLFFNIVQESIESTVACTISDFKSLQKEFTCWKDTYIEIRTQREIERQLALKSSLNFRSLGVGNPQTSLDDQARLLVGVSKNGLTEGRGLTITKDSKGMNIAAALEEVEHSKSLWNPIPLSALLKQSLKPGWHPPWSLGVCYDSMNELTAKWLRIKLGPSHVWPKTVDGVYTYDSNESDPQYSISLIPNSTLEHLRPKSMRFSATVFQVAFFPEDRHNQVKIAKYWAEQRERLREFLYLSSDLNLPLLIMFWPSSDESISLFKKSVESGLGLRSFCGHRFIASYRILIMTTEMMDPGLRDNLCWLASSTIQKRAHQPDKLYVLLNGFQELYDWVLYKIAEKTKTGLETSASQNLSISNLIISTFNEVTFELGRTISSENSLVNASSLRILELCILPTITTSTPGDSTDVNVLVGAYDEFIHSISSMNQNEKDHLYGRVHQMITRNSLEAFSYEEIFNRIGQSILEKIEEYSLNAPLPKHVEGLLKRCRNSVHSQIFRWEGEFESQDTPVFQKRKADLTSTINVNSPKKTKAHSSESTKTNGLSRLISDVKEWLNSL